MAKVFITGVTGYIGGTVLTDLTKSHSSLSLTVLVRTPAQATKINEVHPKVRTVIGDFDSHDLLVSTASASDIVLHIAGDFESGIQSLLSGLANRPTHHKGIFIHVSGAANLLDPQNPNLGQNASKRYSDVSDYSEIMQFAEDRWHVALEHKIVQIGLEKEIKTVILAPAFVYGIGTGTGSRKTFSFEYARDVLKRGRGFLLGKGENNWSGCSVGDVASAIVFVLDETLKDWKEGGSGRIKYGGDGYYFIEGGETSMRERAGIVLKHLKELGAIENEEIDELSAEEVKAMNGFGELLYGSSGRSKADRLTALGWAPKDGWREKVQESTLKEVEAFTKVE